MSDNELRKLRLQRLVKLLQKRDQELKNRVLQATDNRFDPEDIVLTETDSGLEAHVRPEAIRRNLVTEVVG